MGKKVNESVSEEEGKKNNPSKTAFESGVETPVEYP